MSAFDGCRAIELENGPTIIQETSPAKRARRDRQALEPKLPRQIASSHLCFPLSNSVDAHYRILLPLPYVPLVFRWVRPKPYPQNPTTLGQHLHKRRHELGLTQKQVAARLSVNTRTYFLWEHDRTIPTARYCPAIFGFLGYDPFPAPTTLPERLATKRRELGLSIKQAAALLEVDEGTFGRWECGKWKPRMSGGAVRRFLAF